MNDVFLDPHLMQLPHSSFFQFNPQVFASQTAPPQKSSCSTIQQLRTVSLNFARKTLSSLFPHVGRGPLPATESPSFIERRSTPDRRRSTECRTSASSSGLGLPPPDRTESTGRSNSRGTEVPYSERYAAGGGSARRSFSVSERLRLE